MALHTISGEHRGAPVVHVDGAGDGDRALRQQQTVALVLGNLEMIGDDVELLARHVEHGPGERRHGWILVCPASAKDVALDD